MHVAIVGGGAAGLMAAITAKRVAGESVHVTIIEQNREVGKKILASGNGRCNISNISLSSMDYFGKHPSFVTPAIKRFDFDHFLRFAYTIGLVLDVTESGKVYPLSYEARSVQEAMRREARRLGVVIKTDARVTSIERHGERFHIRSKGFTQDCHRLLLATGSPAAPQLGGSRDGLVLAERLGHSLVPSYPTLVGLHLAGGWHERISGVKLQAEVTLYIQGRVEERVRGDLLFTRYGISGFSVLDISTKASFWLDRGKDVAVGLHLLPAFDRQGIVALLQKLIKSAPWLDLEGLLCGLLPAKVVGGLLKFLKIDPRSSVLELGSKQIRRVAATLSDWRFHVVDTHGFKHAETAGGGVDTQEVDSSTMASKRVEGLYFAGEILDIVGKRGGYNLHFAWASGYLAGNTLVKR